MAYGRRTSLRSRTKPGVDAGSRMEDSRERMPLGEIRVQSIVWEVIIPPNTANLSCNFSFRSLSPLGRRRCSLIPSLRLFVNAATVGAWVQWTQRAACLSANCICLIRCGMLFRRRELKSDCLRIFERGRLATRRNHLSAESCLTGRTN